MSEILKTISRVRRAMPRNADVMAICDALEERLTPKPLYFTPHSATLIQGGKITEFKFDKRAYQRDYMRKRRAEGKT